MFDPEKYIKESWNSGNEKTVTVAGEEVRIRRLKGMQWEQYIRAAHGKSEDSAVVVILQHGLVKPFGHYTYEQMVKLYDACPVLADRLVGAILEFTTEQMEAERVALENAEKNSGATVTPSPSEGGVPSTVETPNPQESAEQN